MTVDCGHITSVHRLLLDTSINQDNISDTEILFWLPGKPPKLPADRKPGPAFHVLDEQQASLLKMMANMKVSSANPHTLTEMLSGED